MLLVVWQWEAASSHFHQHIRRYQTCAPSNALMQMRFLERGRRGSARRHYITETPHLKLFIKVSLPP
ncbi:hypothetical protein XELAEV_18040054mg [Xenopus laevis]|uniref:Uncharacterized protein n=1 Tax=Xenopus laevis TaxID=8355 RepID=A0A974C9T8_XENLA|nr:hypothetical protein XELAEV_18040054mg [Xenopus laevis]